MNIVRSAYRICSPPFLDRLNLTFPLRLNGKWLKIPTVGRIGYSNLLMGEQWMIDILQKLLPLKDGAFVDVGVNLGQSLLKLRCVDRDIPYIGFEPNPACVHYVTRLIRRNGFMNCQLVSVGLFNKNEIVALDCYSSETDYAATVVRGFRSQEIQDRFLVPLVKFEDACHQLGIEKVSTIKIDVEGAELEVIQGMQGVLEDVSPFVLCEILPVYSADNRFRLTRQEEAERILKACHYCICRIDKKKNGHLRGLTRLQSLGVHSDLSLCDYLFVPDEMVDRVFG